MSHGRRSSSGRRRKYIENQRNQREMDKKLNEYLQMNQEESQSSSENTDISDIDTGSKVSNINEGQKATVVDVHPDLVNENPGGFSRLDMGLSKRVCRGQVYWYNVDESVDKRAKPIVFNINGETFKDRIEYERRP